MAFCRNLYTGTEYYPLLSSLNILCSDAKRPVHLNSLYLDYIRPVSLNLLYSVTIRSGNLCSVYSDSHTR